MENIIAESFSKKIKLFPKKYFYKAANILTNITKNGENAFFESGSNLIFICGKKDLAASIFHETGHAMNYNLNKFTKLLQECQPLRFLAIPITLIALLHTDKTNKNGEQSNMNKLGSFVKKHAAGLTFLSFLPQIAEEGLASLRGTKVAKQMVNSALLKKINKTNLISFASYALMAIASTLSIHLAVKLSDKIKASKKNTEFQQA